MEVSYQEQIVQFKRKGIPRPIVLAMREKSGNKCAFPGCKTDLVTDTGLLIGEICTIKPLSPNGPRYDHRATMEEYYSFENLIYLCPTHHRLIDTEPDIYTVHFLHQAKQSHERKVENAQNQAAGKKITIPEGLSIKDILEFWKENTDNSNEEFWQYFFSKYPQIIALIIANPLVKIGDKCYLGGKDLGNHSGNLSDFIYKNKITDAVVIVEIKTPKTKLLGPRYRNNAYSISQELSGAVVQTLNYKSELSKNFYSLAFNTDVKFELHNPKCIVICGSVESEALDVNQTRSLELFRNALSDVVVLTYDELYSKLQVIMELKDLAI